jgi:hypothetical protein
LAFSGVPGAFPVAEKNVHLQKYLKWSDSIEKQADEFISSFKTKNDEKFIALHLRNGNDFVSFFLFRYLPEDPVLSIGYYFCFFFFQR